MPVPPPDRPHRLAVIAGALPRKNQKVRVALEEAMAKRWRLDGALASDDQADSRDVIPLLDGWIRRLERQSLEERTARGR